ncbi:MAG: GTP-binding protein, partial [Desulfovibrio sp.]|nr:GTP-binding protein [Desulfovibrio sp.]
MAEPLEMQRTYALVGTGGCGKTSLAEMLLFDAKALSRMGAIEEGTTALDYEPEEARRRGSIQPGVATYSWNKNRHFLVDIPGDGNFTGDIEYLLKAVDSAVFVIDAVDGARPLTKKFWAQVKKENLPAIIVINKLDRDRADFQMAFDSLANLGAKTVALQIPIRENGEFVGYADTLTGKAWRYGADLSLAPMDIPSDMVEELTLLRDVSIENIAESDEELMEKYLEEGSLSPEDLKKGLRMGVLKGELAPVAVCAALENKGGAKLLDIIE